MSIVIPKHPVPYITHKLLGGAQFLAASECAIRLGTERSITYELPPRFQDYRYLSITLVDHAYYTLRLLRPRLNGGPVLVRYRRGGIDPDDLRDHVGRILGMTVAPEASV